MNKPKRMNCELKFSNLATLFKAYLRSINSLLDPALQRKYEKFCDYIKNEYFRLDYGIIRPFI